MKYIYMYVCMCVEYIGARPTGIEIGAYGLAGPLTKRNQTKPDGMIIDGHEFRALERTALNGYMIVAYCYRMVDAFNFGQAHFFFFSVLFSFLSAETGREGSGIGRII